MNRHLDSSLINRVQKGDPDAFGEIYNAHIGKIYRYVLFKVRTREEAEDISADVFLRAWQYLQLQRTVANLNAFLYQVAKNLVIDHYRQRSQREVTMENEVLDQVPDEQQQQLFRQIENSLEVAEVERIVRGLKDEYKDVILLRYVEGLSTGEISSIVGKSRGAVRVTLFRALKLIRDQIATRPKNPSQPSSPIS